MTVKVEFSSYFSAEPAVTPATEAEQAMLAAFAFEDEEETRTGTIRTARSHPLLFPSLFLSFSVVRLIPSYSCI